jgi:hypothetical protein
VLRNILFSGAGVVKEPANPNSVVFETAGTKDKITSDSMLEVDFSELDTPVLVGDSNMEKAIVVDKYNSKVIFVVAKIEDEGNKFSVIDSMVDLNEASGKAVALAAEDTSGSKYLVMSYLSYFFAIQPRIR